jgi:hypothetical protein
MELVTCGAQNQLDSSHHLTMVSLFRGHIFWHLSPQHLWVLKNVPWDCFLPFVEAFNQKQWDLLKTVYFC